MAATQLDAFAQRCSGFLRDEIFPVIVDYLPRRPNPHVPLTVEELVTLLGLPARQLPPPAMVGGVVPPPVGATPAMTQSVATSRKAGSAALDTVIPGQQCGYKFARGDNKNKYCGKPTAAGGKYCSACIKNRAAVKAEVEGNGGVAPAAGAIPGMTGVPPPPTAAAPAQGNSLTVVEYDPSRGLFREPNNNFILCLAGPTGETVTAVGKLIVETNQIVQLSLQERAIAQSLNIALQDAAPVAQPPVPQAHIPVPQAPMPVAVPQAPMPVAVPQAPIPVPAVPRAPMPVAVPVAPMPVAVPVAPMPVAVPVAPVPVAPMPVAVPVPVPAAFPVAPMPVAVPMAHAPLAVPMPAVPVPEVSYAPAIPAIPAIPNIPAVPYAVPVPQAIGGIPDIPALA